MKILPKSEDFIFEDTISFSKEKSGFSSKNDVSFNHIESYNSFKFFIDNITNFSNEDEDLSQNLKKISKLIRDNFQKNLIKNFLFHYQFCHKGLDHLNIFIFQK